MYTTHEISVEEHLAWWEKNRDSCHHRYFMYENDGEARGIVGFTGIDRANQNASWAFYASREAPRGSGSCMEVLALDFAFSELGLHKLCCEVLAFNTPVIRLHKKFGFKVEGVLREQYKREGAFIDIYQLGLLSREWAEARDEMITKLTRFSKG